MLLLLVLLFCVCGKDSKSRRTENVSCIYLIRMKTKRSFIKILRCIIRLYSYSYDSNTRNNDRGQDGTEREENMRCCSMKKRRTYVLDFVPFSWNSLPAFRVWCFFSCMYHLTLQSHLFYLWPFSFWIYTLAFNAFFLSLSFDCSSFCVRFLLVARRNNQIKRTKTIVSYR